MRLENKMKLAALIAFATLAFPMTAQAETATELVTKLDERANLATSQFFEYEVINQEKGRDAGVMRIQVSIQGEEVGS